MDTEQNHIIEAIRQALEEGGWRGLKREELQAKSGVDSAAIQRLAPTPLAALRLVLQHIDDMVTRDGPADAADSPRDRLFEIMMRRYDALLPWRDALRGFSRSLPPDPFSAIGFAVAVERSMGAMLEAAGISATGLAGGLRLRGLGLIHADVLRQFLSDKTTDLAATMKALDQRLKQAEGFARLLERFDPLHRTAAKADGTSMQQNRADRPD
ncbi:MAG: hypothetical protein K0S54_1178 [Alphaproteobacteria bacterium]|jgi:hypothetical protein|nr:hypothetical protein [Alphaproteobacteria bacterium]